MEALQGLAMIIEEIEKTSQQILAEGVDVLADQDEAVDVILEMHEHLESDNVLFRVREATLELLTDAQKIQDEVEAFAKGLARGETINVAACPFLAEVWYGDMYDESQASGLALLKTDLEAQLDQLTIDTVVEGAVKLLGVGEPLDPPAAETATSPAATSEAPGGVQTVFETAVADD